MRKENFGALKYGTIYENFERVAKQYPARTALASLVAGTYQGLKYGELLNRVRALATALQESGLAKGDRVAFLLDNGPDWVTVDLACAAIGAVDVPIHTTYRSSYISYIVKHTEAKWFFTSQRYYLNHQETIKSLELEKIVITDDDAAGFSSLLKTGGTLSSISISGDDLHTIIYTSGTTGLPKGVMLSHRNLLSNVQNAKEYIDVSAQDRFLSFLPLSHALERTAGCFVPLLSGASIYYAQSKDTIKDDIVKARPTIIISVPRIFEKTYDAVWDAVRSGSKLKQWLFYRALDYGSAHRKGELRFWQQPLYGVLDFLVLKKIRSKLGGRLRFSVSGGSALSTRIIQFFWDIGLFILEGYGLTETSPVVSENTLAKYQFGSVGLLLKNFEIKIAADNEILLRGSSVTRGYWRDPEATKQAIDKEGWLRTGDLGRISEDGFLFITGRKKELLVLSTGRNVAPVPLEQALETNRFISQAMIFGDNQKHISALIVPDFEELKLWAQKNGVEYGLPAILQRDDVKKLYNKEILEALDHFPEYEQVRHFILLAEPFTQESDLLTPTLKLKRVKILEKYKDLLNQDKTIA